MKFQEGSPTPNVKVTTTNAKCSNEKTAKICHARTKQPKPCNDFQHRRQTVLDRNFHCVRWPASSSTGFKIDLMRSKALATPVTPDQRGQCSSEASSVAVFKKILKSSYYAQSQQQLHPGPSCEVDTILF